MKLPVPKKRKIVSELNITNLVDVTFALLIIFMITAPMMTQGVQIDLPQTESESVEVTEAIQVAIDERNEIYINEERVSLFDFRKRFNEIFGNRFQTPVLINADKGIPYGLVMKVIADVQNAGVVKLGFITAPVDIRRD